MAQKLHIYTASPRGFCAGVNRAVQTAEQALAVHTPIYIRREIVHNRIVVERLQSQGAIFVNELAEIPSSQISDVQGGNTTPTVSDVEPLAEDGRQTVLFSAHGVAPAVRRFAQLRGFKTIDATCPLVNLVHQKVLSYQQLGYQIIYIGHSGHDEVEGVLGEVENDNLGATTPIWLVQNISDVDALPAPETLLAEQPLVWLSQTTLSVAQTDSIVQRLRARYHTLQDPDKSSICYATTNRQDAIKGLINQLRHHQRSAVIVVGSVNSSNTQRLVELAITMLNPTDTYNVDQLAQLDLPRLLEYDAIGITSGASVPEDLVDETVQALLTASNVEVILEELRIVEENMFFKLPQL